MPSLSRMLRNGCLCVLLLACSVGLTADEQINTSEPNFQQDPRVARAPDGRTIVVWANSGEIAGRLYDASGQPVSDEELSLQQGGGARPDVVMFDDGSFVVAWDRPGAGNAIHGRRFAADGTLIDGTFDVHSQTGVSYGSPAIARQPNRGFVVVWFGRNGDGDWVIFGRQFDGAAIPLGPQFQVNETIDGSLLFAPKIDSDGQGNFFVVWHRFSPDTILGRRFDAAAMPLAGEIVLSATTKEGEPDSPTVAVADSGTALAVWIFRDGTARVVGQFFDASGTPAPQTIELATFLTSGKAFTSASAEPSGSFHAVWESNGQDGGGSGIFGRRVSSTGIAKGDEMRINMTTAGNQGEPDIEFGGSAGPAVAWQSPDSDGTGIFGNCLQDDDCTVMTETVFLDGFESGDVAAWSASAP